MVSNEALQEYVGESEEILRRVGSILEHLERGAAIGDHIDAFYRDMHTLKGSSQLFGFSEIGNLAHAIEAGLGPIRKHKVAMTPDMIQAVYQCLDLFEVMLKALVSGNNKDSGEQKSKLDVCMRQFIDAAYKQFGGDQKLVSDPLVVTESKMELEGLRTKLAIGPGPTPEPVRDVTQAVSASPVTGTAGPAANVPSQSVAQAQPTKGEAVVEKKDGPPSSGGASGSESTIRVQVELLDRLMNLAGELVLVRNQVLQFAGQNESLEFLNLSQSLDLVTSELQEEVMRTRMQPIGNVISKFQRVVRDLARDLGKQIDLTIQGAETELDKTLLEAIKDPLTHLVRNSCDHGIESVEDRSKAGKPSTGHVLIRSFHEGGQVVVEISDDGKGLDRDRIASKAVEKGLLNQDRVARMSDREVFNLIFLPGFSTAQQVSAVSGRGVGMDVVKTNIEKIGGTVDLSSQLGKGTTIKLKIPLTLAIVPALIVKHHGHRFAIPQVKLVELVRVEGKEEGDRIEYLQQMPMYRLRGTLLPLVDLGGVLSEGAAVRSAEEKAAAAAEGHNIVVLNAEGENFGIIVDEILDTADIVVKPLNQILKHLSVFSGATIMGDGSVALILDVVGVANKASIRAGSQKKEDAFSDLANAKRLQTGDSQEFLLLKLNAPSVHAIPLCLVHRLEEVGMEQIELTGDQQVVQYRKSILPLISLNDVLKYSDAHKKSEKAANPGAAQGAPQAKQSIVVMQKSSRLFGLKVDEILDVVVVSGAIDDTIRDREGVLGNLLHNDEVIVVIDALQIIERELTRFSKKDLSPDTPSGGGAKNSFAEIDRIRREQNSRIKILFAEDVSFFRKQVTRVLNKAGYEVVVAEHGAAAMKVLERSPAGEFHLILSDIEMPEMTGLEFARAVRAHPKVKDIPMIALTTKFKDSDIKEGKRAGFTLYLEKLNEEILLKGIESILGKSEQVVASA